MKPEEVLVQGPDEGGVYSFWVKFPNYPRIVKGGSEDFVLHEKYDVQLPFHVKLYAMDSFIGLVWGDRGEFSVEIDDAKSGSQAYQRSLHKEEIQSFEAFAPQYRWLQTDRVSVFLDARTTKPNAIGELQSYVHFAAYLYGWKVE